MREIKFRAWNKLDKGICLRPMQILNESGEFEFDRCGHLAYSYSLHQAIRSDDVDVMQYTGLKDKNGVEIYEGDIIKVTVPDECPDEESIQKVEMCEGFWKLELINPAHDYDFTSIHVAVFYDDHEIEVIGNIYENPELLETKE